MLQNSFTCSQFSWCNHHQAHKDTGSMFYVDELRDKVTPLCWEVARNLVETSMKSGLQEPGTGIFREPRRTFD